MRYHSVDLRIAAPAPLVHERGAIPDASQDEAMPDAVRCLCVLCQPGDGANRSRNEEKPVSVTPWRRLQPLCKECRDRDAGQIVITQRRVADVAGEKHLIRCFTR